MNEERSRSIYSAADLASKSSEIAEKIRVLRESGSLERGELARLFSELLFSLFVLSERYGVSLEDSFLQVVDELILGFVA